MIGDAAVGKTTTLIRYTWGEFPADYVPGIVDNYSCTVPSPHPFPTYFDFARQLYNIIDTIMNN
jgi:GTPase SAR1 family protein